MAMTLKQKLFVVYYLGVSNGNATDAARRAGYAWPEKVAERLVGKSGIRAAIDAKMASAAIPADELLARLSEVVQADLLDFVNLEPKAKKPVTMATLRRLKRQGKGHLIKRLKFKNGDIEIELEPKYGAAVKLGEFLGLWDRDRPPESSIVEMAKRFKAWLDQNDKHD
jgi:hypothetical protein